MRCFRGQFVGIWNSEEEFGMQAYPKGSGECVDEGGVVDHFIIGNPGQDDKGNHSPGRRGRV